MITFPNAKINLGLNVVEKRPDGYHNLETVFYPIKLQDALEVNRLEGSDLPYKIHTSGTVIEGNLEDNLVIKAYNLLKAENYQMLPVDIHLDDMLQEKYGITPDWVADRLMLLL